MAAERTPHVGRAIAPGRLLLLHLSIALLVVGGAALYWFGLKVPAEHADVRASQDARLQAYASAIRDRRDLWELAAATLVRHVESEGSAKTIAGVDALPSGARDTLALQAVSWWPKSRNGAPRYWARDGQGWAEQALNADTVLASVRDKPWFVLADALAGAQCLWSEREREAVSQATVVSCSRAVVDRRGTVLGVLRLSFELDVFTTALQRPQAADADTDVLLVSRMGSLIAAADTTVNDQRNLADIGRARPELSPLMAGVFADTETWRTDVQALSPFPASLAALLQSANAAVSEAEAREQLAGLWNAPESTQPASWNACAGDWCAYSQAVPGTPWALVSLGALPSPVGLAREMLPAHMPLAVFAVLVLIGGLLGYLLTLRGWLRPMARLLAPIARQDTTARFDENLRGEWGHIAQALNAVAAPRLATATRDGSAAGTRSLSPRLPLDQLPVATIVVDSNGRVRSANALAISLIDVAPGSDASNAFLRRESDGSTISLAELPNEWLGEPCVFRNDRIPGRYGISTLVTGAPLSRIIMVAPLPASSSPASPAATSVAAPEKLSSGLGGLRRALAQLTAPSTWISLQVQPELVTPALAAPDAQTMFAEQLQARLEDRLEDGERIFLWSRNHFVIMHARGLTDERAQDLRLAVQSTLIFLASERVRLKAKVDTVIVRPHMNSEEFDSLLHGVAVGHDGEPGDRRVHDQATLIQLVNKGFADQRFHLITEHGARPGAGKAVAASAFRVRPHLEDDEGFWMGAREYQPVLQRLKRRGEHDTWLIDAVHEALQTLGGEAPEQILLPLCGEALANVNTSIAEKLGVLVRDARVTSTTIFALLDAGESQESDLPSVQQLCTSLGCRFALTNIGLDTRSLALLEQLRPDMMLLNETLVETALTSPVISVGLESLVRVGDKLKCQTVLPGIHSDRGLLIVEKLRPTLAFGRAIGKPSPLPFRAVA
ncbi:MAG: EAL domain-containing protein [Oceanococcaceae bacterium]